MKKVVVVSGGSGELGREIAMDLVSNDYVVAFTYYKNKEIAIELEAKLKKINPYSTAYQVDVTNSLQIKRFSEELRKKFKSVYGLINCAGISPSSDSLMDIDESMWDTIQAVNLKGTFLMCKYILPLIINYGEGRIVTISSIHGENPPALRTAYGASKAGVIGLSRSLSKEVAKNSICVNTICPGPIKTDMLTNIWKKTAIKMGLSFEKYVEGKLSEIPLGKMCLPSDVSAGVVFLLSNAAGQITGTTIDINGGAV